MPYKSEAQRGFFHTSTAKKAGIKPSTVKDFDSASKGMKLPERVDHIKGITNARMQSPKEY